MNISRLLGFVIFVVGIVLLVFGWNASHSVAEKLVEGASGKYTDKTMWYIIGGIVLVIVGGALTFCKRCCKK